MSNLLKSKLFLGVLVVTLLVAGGVALVGVSKASADCSITTTLRVGSTGTEVSCLQTKVGATADGKFGPMTKASVMAFQASHGLSSDGVVGPLTRAVLNGVVSGGSFPAGCTSNSGYSSTTGMPCTSGTSLPAGCTSTSGYSPTTGQACSGGVTLPAGCTSTSGYSTTTGQLCSGGTTVGPLAGGAGSLSEVKKDSTYSQVEVNQGETSVKVDAFTVKADTGSDLAIQTLALDLQNTGAGSTNLNHYFDSVSIWEDGTRVATANMADFTKSGTVYSKNIQLSNAVVRAGQTNEFYIVVDASANIDAADLAAANTWQATVQSMRYTDGTGAIMTDSTTGIIGGGGADDLSTFSFVTLAASGGKELKIVLTTGQDAINKAHVAIASTTSTTNDVPLLAFDIKAKGQINHITSIPFGVKAMGGTGSVNEIASSFSLWENGVKIDTIDVSEGTGAGSTPATDYTDVADVAACAGTNALGCGIDFNDIDFSLADGSTTHFVIKANLKRIIGGAGFTEGDALLATINANALAAIQAEDVNTDAFVQADGDMVGSATGEQVTFRSLGISVALVNTTANVAQGASAQPDIGTYTITFDATAFGADMYVDGVAPTINGANNGTEVVITTPGTAGLSAEITSPTGATRDGVINAVATTFLVPQDTTQRFTVTAIVTPTATGGLTNVSIDSIGYGTVTGTTGILQYTTNLTNFVTPSVNLKLTN